MAGGAALGVPLTTVQAQALQRLLDELDRWNQSYNLTAIKSREEMLTHHLLDSLAVAPFLRGQRVIDVGTGAGFPGLPLAIVQPQRQFVLLDSNGKKVRFVAHAARTLQLSNVAPVHARAESHEDPSGFDCVVARAFAPLSELIPLVAGLCSAETRVLAMKGRRDPQDREALAEGWSIEADHELLVPGLHEARHVLVLRPPHRLG
jgi:16S rRNA (guanine527-N7)-methyltransferase